MNMLVTTSRLAAFAMLLAMPALAFSQTPGEHMTGTVNSAAWDDGSWGCDAGFGGTCFEFMGEQGLFAGNLLVGQSATQVSGEAYADPQEFTTVAAISTIAPFPGFNQGFQSTYNDSGLPDDIGVTVVQRSYSSTTAGNTDFIYYSYEITNTSGGTLSNIYVGNFSDWDVNGAVDNSACYDPGSQLLYVWSATPGTSYFGTAVVNNTVSGWDADGSAGNPDDAGVWAAMTNGGGSCSTTLGDRRVTIGQGPYTIANGETINPQFCMVGGTDVSDAISNALACQALVVPVELLGFNGVLDGTDLSLTWATASETNNAGFEVQVDRGSGYEVLGFVDGHGTTTEAQLYTFGVSNLTPGTHSFRLKQIDYDGAFQYYGGVEVTIETPGQFVLLPTYPNPFNPEATIRFAVRESSLVSVTVHDVLGRQVATIYEGTPEANQTMSFRLDGSSLTSGTYVVRLAGSNGTMASQTITLLK